MAVLKRLLTAALVCAALGANAQDVADPAMLGRELRAASVFPDSWLYAEVAGVRIISTADASAIARAIGDLGIRSRALETFWPARTDLPMPTIIVARNSEDFRTAVPGAGPRLTAGLSSRGGPGGSPRMALNLEVPTANGAASIMNGIDRQALNFGVAAMKFQRLGPGAAVWLDRALEKLIVDMEATRTSLDFRAIKDDPTFAARKAGSPEGMQKAMAAKTFFPLEQIFTAADLGASVQATNEAYEFVHLCLFGQLGKYRKPFLDFVAAQTSGTPWGPAQFKAAFGIDTQAMLLEVWKYDALGKSTSYKVLGPDGKQLGSPPKLVTRKATDEELGQFVVLDAPARSGSVNVSQQGFVPNRPVNAARGARGRSR